jgi:hypothetical protein
MDKAWVGVDAGKEFHWAHLLDASGRELLSRKVENDEADISKLIDEVLFLAEEVVWALDQPGGGAALFLQALLRERNQRVLYIPGLSVLLGPATPTGESPRLMPVMPMSSPTPGPDEAGPRRTQARRGRDRRAAASPRSPS